MIDLYMHHRTQQLMCLEFDMTHLKLADAEASFQSFDDFSVYGHHSDNATPFLGIPKKNNVIGTPQNFLFNQQSYVAN